MSDSIKIRQSNFPNLSVTKLKKIDRKNKQTEDFSNLFKKYSAKDKKDKQKNETSQNLKSKTEKIDSQTQQDGNEKEKIDSDERKNLIDIFA